MTEIERRNRPNFVSEDTTRISSYEEERISTEITQTSHQNHVSRDVCDVYLFLVQVNSFFLDINRVWCGQKLDRNESTKFSFHPRIFANSPNNKAGTNKT